jgi:EAL domain-containing protein (putative c-di-GMP-specific phosphodiesterase class I)
MRHTYMEHAAILSSFRSSIRNGDFQVWYQPIVRASDGRLCSAEALVRWIHPKAGMLSPGNFIPALEKGGMISELDRYVVKHVFSFQDDLKTSGLATVPISVNLSRQDFYDDQLMSDVFRLAQEHNLTGRCVNFEVTETSVAALRQNCSYLLGQIRQSGAKVLLDDFGSGYSSLSMIGDYSFDIIKIDKSFISHDELQDKDRAIIGSIIKMAELLHVDVITEGVENMEQVQFLQDLGCTKVHGYLYGKPLPPEQLEGMLDRQAAGMLPS